MATVGLGKTFSDLKADVQALLPLNYDQMVIATDVDATLTAGLKKIFSKYEFQKCIEITGPTTLPDCMSVTKFAIALGGSYDRYSVFNPIFGYFGFAGVSNNPTPRIGYYLTPQRRLIPNYGVPGNWYVEYWVDPAFLTIADLNYYYYDRAIRYCKALINIKEGTRGLHGTLNALPYDMQYSSMKEEGLTEKAEVELELEENYFGLYAGK